MPAVVLLMVLDAARVVVAASAAVPPRVSLHRATRTITTSVVVGYRTSWFFAVLTVIAVAGLVSVVVALMAVKGPPLTETSAP